VLSFVFDDAASHEVWFGPSGAASGATEGTIAVECSTLSVAGAERWAEDATRNRLTPIHAPVTGSRPGANSGSLVVFAGADEGTLRKADWLFELIAREVVPCGTAASAAGFKLANNLFASTVLVGLAETLALAEGMGVDVPQLVDVLSRHGWGTKVADSKGVDMAGSSYGDVMCALRTISKDVGYALTAAEAAGVSLPVAAQVARQWELGERLGAGDQDMAAIKRVYD
jgi:3-hydroxyisobutyrate dehydrogenase